MGHKFSTVHGVKSNNFYESGNAINEIWLGNLEIISRLPFGDSDIRQAGWPQGTWPKIPWHQFIIPLKRDIHPVACDGPACHPAPSMQTSLALRRRVVSFYVASLLVLLMILIRLLVKLSLRWNRVVPIHLKDPENSISQVHNPVISEHCSRPLSHVNPGENKNASNDMTAVDSSRALNL